MTDRSPKGNPIFILGIAHRSGTNYLSDLLRLHPDCGRPAPVWEDFLAHHADHLVRYVSSVCRHWYSVEDTVEVEQTLSRNLGDALITFLDARHDRKRTVTKTPSVRNLEYFFKLFPNARLIVLVRDGRAVVESSIRSFGGSFEGRARHWAEAARTIVRFDEARRGSGVRYMIVRYEDLWRDMEGHLKRILEFVDLDTRTYDFGAAADVPVRGSSVLGRRAGKVHWDPVERTAEFDPVNRWAGWSRSKHERFNWIAGRYLGSFGYAEQKFGTNQVFWTLWNVVLDVRWLFVGVIRSIGSWALRGFPEDYPVRRKIRTILRRIGVEG